MKATDLINKVARIADTAAKGSHITVTDVRRVHSKIFLELSKLPTEELLLYVAKEVAAAKKKRAAEKAKK